MEGIVSIIVPVYNARNTLERCVRSLVSQTYDRLEIILVNDGSKDDSLQLCRTLAAQDDRIRVIDKPNGGVSSARNAGLDAAKGEYIMFCDSDDWVSPDWCRQLVARYQPECLTVCEIAWDDEPEGAAEDAPLLIVPRKEYLHHPDVMSAIWNKIYSRKVLEENQLRFSAELSLGEDFCFAMEYLSIISGDVRILKRKLYHYDTSADGSLSKKAPDLKQCDGFYWAMRKAMDIIGMEDSLSIATRNDFVIRHYARFLEKTSLRKDLSFWKKMKIAGDVKRMQSFSDCCENGMRWGNPLYIWFYQKNQVHLVMLFLILRSMRDRLRSIRK